MRLRIEPVEGNGPGCRRQQTGEHFHQSGFARAVGSEQRADGARRHIETDAIHGRKIAEAFAEVAAVDHAGIMTMIRFHPYGGSMKPRSLVMALALFGSAAPLA